MMKISKFCVWILAAMTAADESKGPCTVHQNAYYTLTNAYDNNVVYYDNDLVYPAVPNNGDNQKFSFQKIPYALANAHAYAILAKHHGLAITQDNDGFRLKAYKGDKSQMFRLVPNSNGCCALQLLESDKVFGTNESDSWWTVFIRQYPDKESKGTSWKFNEMYCDPYPHQPYRLINRKEDFVVTVESGKLDDGARMLAVHQDQDAYHSQVTFEVDSVLENLYHIVLRHSNKELNPLADTEKTVIVQQTRSESGDSKWHVEPAPAADTWCTIKGFNTQRFMDIDSENPSKFDVMLGSHSPTSSSHFRLQRVGFEPEPGKLYRLRNVHSNKYLEVEINFRHSVKPVHQAPYAARYSSQFWTFVPHNGIKYQYHLQAYKSKISLALEEGTHAVVASKKLSNSTHHHFFEVKEMQPGSWLFRLEFQYKHLALTPVNGSGEDYAKLVAVPGGASAAQLWEIEVDVR